MRLKVGNFWRFVRAFSVNKRFQPGFLLSFIYPIIIQNKKHFRPKMTVEVEKKAVDLGLLEEDDEFEEFPTKGG